MKLNKNKNIKFVFAIAGILFAFALQLLIAPIGLNVNNVYASSYTQVTISNGNFNNSPSTYYMDSSPTGWTKINTNVPAYSGIINTNDDKFSSYTETYKLTTNPQTMYVDTTDTKILMINAKNANSTTNTFSQGYRSNSIALSANSYYYFSILVKTEVGAVASVYLEGLTDGDETLEASQTSFTNISSHSWKEYKFYVETGSSTQSITFSLWLGSKTLQSPNAVFFDNVTGYQLTPKRFANEQEVTTYSKTIELTKNYLTSVTNANFETGNTSGWTSINAFPTNAIYRVINTDVSQEMTVYNYTSLGGDNVFGNRALWLATKGTYGSFGYASSNLTIERFAIYKLQVNVKVDSNTVAQVSIVENDDVKDYYEENVDESIYEYEPTTTDLTVSSNTTNDLTNNYTTYTFYIKGHSLFDTSIHIELSLQKASEDDTQVVGSALFDNITFERVSSTEYDSSSASSSVKKVEFTTLTDSTTITNGTFNSATVEKTGNVFPVAPTGWTSTVNSETENVYGIVNTNQTHYEANKTSYGNLTNPKNPSGFSSDVAKETNNIMMLYNKVASYQSVTSSSISISSGTYYALTFDYKIIQQGINFNVSVFNANNVKVFEQDNLPYSTWTKYTLIIKGSDATSSLTLKLSLGTKSNKAQGWVFIDNVDIAETTLTDETYTAKVNSQNGFNKCLDLTDGLFNTRLLKNEDNTYELASFAGSLDNGTQGNTDAIAEAGIVDGNSNMFGVLSSENNTKIVKNIYFIHNYATATFSITSNESISISSGTIYKFTVYMRTRLASVDDSYDVDYGATFSLDGIDGKIENIRTNDEWKEITIIVNTTTSSNVNLKFSLTSQSATTGILFVDNYTLTTLTTEEYATYVAQYEDEDADNDNLLIVGSTDIEDEDDDTTEDEETTDFNWLILPSLMFGLALIFAIGAVAMKKINFKKFSKKKAAEYDRKKTLYRDVIRKEAEERRDAELKTLNEEMLSIDTTMKSMEEENKERLVQQRRKKVDKETERQFKAYATQHTKLQNKKDALINKINQVNSAEYLLTLQKKITQEQIQKLQTEPNTKVKIEESKEDK